MLLGNDLIYAHRYYGWARLSVQVSRTQFTVTATLTGYAYETIPGKAIIAGNIIGREKIDNSVGPPKPASLADRTVIHAGQKMALIRPDGQVACVPAPIAIRSLRFRSATGK